MVNRIKLFDFLNHLLEFKKLVGYKAVDDYVVSNMVVGLGTGSVNFFGLFLLFVCAGSTAYFAGLAISLILILKLMVWQWSVLGKR
jgi:hypothetical protein